MKVFAHRGFSGKYPENTMLAFEKAVEVGADGIELDIHETSDKKLVIIHDEMLARTAGKPGVIGDYTLSEAMKIEANQTHPEHKGTMIPSFDEYCDYIKDKDIVTNVEIKTNLYYYERIEEKLLETLKRFKLEEKVIVSSFNWMSVAHMKKIAPHIKCGLLLERSHIINIAALAKDHGVEYYHPDLNIIDDEDVACCRKNSIKLNCWTANTQEQIQKLITWDVAGAIGNFPDLTLRMLNRA